MSTKSSLLKVKKKIFENLNEIVSVPRDLVSTVGVVIDSTGPYLTNFSYEYMCKFRIIDNTYNSKDNKKKGLENYV